MKKHQSKASRLARLFEASREVWKKKAQARQKKLRQMDIKIRDLTKSREEWKRRTKALEQQVRQLEKEKEEQAKELEKKRKVNSAKQS